MNPDLVQMAVIHRPCSSGVDLPAGASADQITTTDYHVIEMPDVGIQMARIHRPNNEVVDYPPGATIDQMRPSDFRVIEVQDP